MTSDSAMETQQWADEHGDEPDWYVESDNDEEERLEQERLSNGLG